MASKAEITIRVTSTRGATNVAYTTKGKYVSFQTAGLSNDLKRLPIQPTASLMAFWTSILTAVQADIAAGS